MKAIDAAHGFGKISELLESKKIGEDTLVTIIALTNESAILSRAELYNFQRSYGLEIEHIDGKKAVSLNSVVLCKEQIENKYSESKKNNILQSLKKIRIWEKVIRQYINDKNDSIEKQKELLNKDVSISVYDFIKKEKKSVSFLETIKDFRFYYGLSDNGLVDPTRFKKYLDYNHYQLDPQDFLKAMFIIGSQVRN